MQFLAPSDLLAAAAVCRHWHFVATSCRELLITRLLAEAPIGGSMFEPASSLLKLPHLYNCMHANADGILEVHSDNVAEGLTTQLPIKSTARATNRKSGVTTKRKAKWQKEKVATGGGASVISLGIGDRRKKDEDKILNV